MSAAFTISFWLTTTAGSADLPALVTDKDWDGGQIVDVTSHHDFGLSRTTASQRGWAIALGTDGAWMWNAADGEGRVDFRPPATAHRVNDGQRHFLAFSIDPVAAEARLYRDGEPAAILSIAGLGSLRSGEAPRLAERIGEARALIEDLRVEEGVVAPGALRRRWLDETGGATHEASPAPRVESLRVMAWNIWHGGRRDGNAEGLQATIDAIRDAGADVVAMQETYGSGAHIAAGLGFHYYLRSSNLSVLSRWPIVATHDLYEPFRFGGVTLELSPGQRLRLFSLWIHYLPDYGGVMKDEGVQPTPSGLVEAEMETRGREIEAILEQLTPILADSDDVPVIVAGDFNSPSHLDWRDNTADRHRGLVVDWPVSRSMARAGFTDAFRVVHPDPVTEPGRTWSPRFTGAWQDRIDFVYLHGSALRATSARMIDRVAPRWPSDHAAVVLDVAIDAP